MFSFCNLYRCAEHDYGNKINLISNNSDYIKGDKSVEKDKKSDKKKVKDNIGGNIKKLNKREDID